MSLHLHGIRVRYGRHTVLDGISAEFPDGAVTALIGRNGAGKSTLLRAAAGLLACDGAITLDGTPASPSRCLGAIAYMPQDTSANSSLTLLEVVLLGRLNALGLMVEPALVREAEAMLDRFGLAQLSGRTLDAISGGQRQLCYLAQALFRRPRVLLLDEPTAALDLKHQLDVLQTVRHTARRDRIAIGLAMHDLSLAAQFADRLLCLHEGAVDVCGPPAEVLTRDRLARLYGVEAEITPGPNGCPRVTPIRTLERTSC